MRKSHQRNEGRGPELKILRKVKNLGFALQLHAWLIFSINFDLHEVWLMYLQMKNDDCFTTLLAIEQAACCWPGIHCIISARTPWQLFHLISTALHSSIHGCNVHCKLPSFSLYPHGFFFSSRSKLCLLKYLGFARKWYTVNIALPSSGARIGLYIESKRANTDGQQEK